MFEQPSSKRVRREELYSPRSPRSSRSPSLEPDPALAALLKSRLASVYGSDFEVNTAVAPETEPTAAKTPAPEAQSIETNAQDTAPDNAEEGFVFRLFAGPTPRKEDAGATSGTSAVVKTAGAQIILLDDEGGDSNGEVGGLIQRPRDPTYYFAAKAEGLRKQQFEEAAVSGDDVRRWLGIRYWGWEVPWRVRVLRVQNGSKSVVTDVDGGKPLVLVPIDAASASSTGKKKPGKKRRIILRQRKRAADALLAEKLQSQQTKEAAEREKKTRRNREKKVKKRAKEKALKAVLGKEDGADGSADSDAAIPTVLADE